MVGSVAPHTYNLLKLFCVCLLHSAQELFRFRDIAHDLAFGRIRFHLVCDHARMRLPNFIGQGVHAGMGWWIVLQLLQGVRTCAVVKNAGRRIFFLLFLPPKKEKMLSFFFRPYPPPPPLGRWCLPVGKYRDTCCPMTKGKFADADNSLSWSKPSPPPRPEEGECAKESWVERLAISFHG